MYCPFCGKELIELENKANICIDSSCRCVIHKGKIGQLTIDGYSRYSEDIRYAYECINKNNQNIDKYYMLLKKNSDEPMLFNNTTSPIEKNKQTLCILKCKSFEEAVKNMQEKFKIMSITPDMVVEVGVKIKQ